MKIFHKILGFTLPAVLTALFMGSWLTYYLSGQALNLIAERWLDTRLSEAVALVTRHEEFLRLYNITNIAAGTKKAQLDAKRGIASIQIGNRGYVYVLDMTGRVLFHPDPGLVGTDVGDSHWFLMMLKNTEGAVSYHWQGEDHLGMFSFFEPWGWIVVATDPLSEIYGPVRHARKYILTLAVLGSLGISMLIILLTGRLVEPLGRLVEGARKVGRGDLDIHLPVTSNDEIGQLSKAFNRMSRNLQKSLGALRQSETYFRTLTENSTDLIALLTPGEGRITYLSPSITRLLGFQVPPLKGNPFDRLMTEASRPDFREFIAELGRKPDAVLVREFAFYNSSAETRILEISGRNLTGEPCVAGIVLNSRDITTRKRIENELKASELRLQQLSSRLISAQEDERKRLSVELHDEVGQSLAVLKLKVILLEEGLDAGQSAAASECEAMVAYIDRMIENVRRLSKDLTPSTIEDLGLSAALMWLVETVRQHYTIHADIQLDTLDEALSIDSQILVYRIFQEAISNAVRHARAHTLRLSAAHAGTTLTFTIADDGCGFIPPGGDTGRGQSEPSGGGPGRGMGLATMQARARMLGGTFNLDTAPGEGTVLQFKVPLDKDKDDG